MKKVISMKRSAIARETVAICEAGYYTTPGGVTVRLESAIRDSVSGTMLHSADVVANFRPSDSAVSTKIRVTNESTIAALQRLYVGDGGHLACLNFASAKNAGGGFLGGAEAQEESLARSSALYPCLLAAPKYYEANRASGTCLYLDLAIWSPQVAFFRDDRGTLLDEPVFASAITSPAPNAGAVASNEPARLAEIEPTLRRRAEVILAVAGTHGVRRLVLGAWGCGVFRNDPRMVARVFRDLLTGGGRFTCAFDEVAFAIYDRSPGSAVLRVFEETFG